MLPPLPLLWGKRERAGDWWDKGERCWMPQPLQGESKRELERERKREERERDATAAEGGERDGAYHRNNQLLN